MAAIATFCCLRAGSSRPVMRHVSPVAVYAFQSPKKGLSTTTQQEIFSGAIKSLWSSQNGSDLDPRDVPRTTGISSKAIDKLPIIHIKATFNNTLITITDHKGHTLAWTSAGAEGFKNARKGTSFAAQSAGTSAGLKASALGINCVKVQLKGLGPGRQHSLKGLDAAGIDVAVIQDVTPIPHNGCKPKKRRRL